MYYGTPSASVDGVSTDLKRTHNGGTTEAEHIKDERIKLLEERIAFLEEQVDFYKNRK